MKLGRRTAGPLFDLFSGRPDNPARFPGASAVLSAPSRSETGPRGDDGTIGVAARPPDVGHNR
jgi:hypothetical protein